MDERFLSQSGRVNAMLDLSRAQQEAAADQLNAAAAAPAAPVIGPEQLKKLVEVLEKYKAGKKNTETRIVASENWWKLRNNAEEACATIDGASYKSRSGWLHNVIVNKHADAMEAYPEPNILPREDGDKEEAHMLTSIVPCILEQNDFEQTYSDVHWQKGKTGTGVYKTVWEKDKLNGLGEISVVRANLLNLYWQPGITDIQFSRYFFETELMDKEVVEQMYPQTKDRLKGQTFISTKFLYDDTVSTDDKVTIIDCYYHTYDGPRKILQYVKFVNDIVLFATENDPEMAKRGLYDHGLYPYVFDAMFPIEGSPCGYGFVDLCANPQTTIDLLNTAFVKNATAGATPRFFKREDGGINETEFLDLTKSIVHVSGNLGEDSIREIPHQTLDGVYVNFHDRVVQELRETSGNTETATGSTSAGVTAASAIAALQEASGKGSKDANLSSYRAFSNVVNMVIELIRQFYDLPRKFRILGQYGTERYITYTNQGIQPQQQFGIDGSDNGFRLPVFDIKVSAQKKSVYTKVSQNELALQFFQMGFFNPQMTDQALMCLDMMDFDSKDTVTQKVAQNGTMFQKLVQYMQLALTLAAKAAPEMVDGLSQDIMQTMGVAPAAGGAPAALGETASMPDTEKEKEHPVVQKARARSQAASQPDGGAVTGGAKG